MGLTKAIVDGREHKGEYDTNESGVVYFATECDRLFSVRQVESPETGKHIDMCPGCVLAQLMEIR